MLRINSLLLSVFVATLLLLPDNLELHAQSLQDSIRIYNEQRTKLDKAGGISKDIVIQLHARLGDAYMKIGDLVKAEAAYLDGMALIETTSNRSSSLSPWLIVRLARVYRITGQTDLAWDMLTSAYQDVRSYDTDKTLLIAMLHHERGLLAINRPQESETSNPYDYGYRRNEYESQEYGSTDQEEGSYSSEYGSEYSNSSIREALYIRGDETSPLTLLRKSYTLYKNTKRVPPAQMVEVVVALSALYSERGNVNEGIELLSSFIRELPNSGFEVDQARYEAQGALAASLLKSGRILEALEQYKSLVLRQPGSSLKENSLYIETLASISNIYSTTNNSKEAFSYAKQAVDRAESLYGSTSIAYANVLSSLATAQLLSGDTSQAIQTLLRQRGMIADSTQTSSKLFISVSGKLGELYTSQNKLAEAESMLQSALQTAQSSASTNQLGMIMINLAEVRSKLGNDTSADSLLTAGIRILSRSDRNNTSYSKGLVLAARIKERLEEYEAAADYYEEAFRFIGRGSYDDSPDAETISLGTEITKRMIALNVQVDRPGEAMRAINRVIEIGERYSSITPQEMFRYQQLYCKLYLQAGYQQTRYGDGDDSRERSDYYLTQNMERLRDLYSKIESPSARDRIAWSEIDLEVATINQDYSRAESALADMLQAADESGILSSDTLLHYHTLRAIYRSKAHDQNTAKQEIDKALTQLAKVSQQHSELSLARIDRAFGEYYLDTKQLDSAATCFARAIEQYSLLRSVPKSELGQAHLSYALALYAQEDFARAASSFEEADKMGVSVRLSSASTAGGHSLAYARSLAFNSQYEAAYEAYKLYIKYLQQRDGRYNESLVEPLKEMLNIVENTRYSDELRDLEDYIEQIRLGPHD